MNPKNFFVELRRRNVYRVGVAYAVAGWLIIQIATSTFPYLEIPQWGTRLVIVLIGLGFVVPMMFVLGTIFAVLWGTAYFLGRKIERERAEAYAAYEAERSA